ncbi:succinyl-diaminopimelate desuccinylase [Solimicrobium silvestre]|uniref:Succinyl-diaminopimelate desuccinylase n=1 Tax=Solimicrobium silvestre TaxID=2099400 RepID=A0A2S9GUE0_9BURK|nr:succinyl-diaminopimelate desuccinylase [Solimicrobium silvestre]PRC91324.1 Succinyl-diaminopimelate desuccinylase [Solimicrobium silvestre]
MSKTLKLTEQLISLESVTPSDLGCQQLMIDMLTPLGFVCESIESGNVSNLWARKGTTQPLIVFAGHTDVVPTGPLGKWVSDPFVPTIRHGMLYGRGAADMKSSIAAMLVAAEEFIQQHPEHPGSIGFLITSDEEGPATDGTVVVCDLLKQRGEQLDFCVVGEPTSSQHFGDTIKNGRRGSMSGKLVIHGIQGHIAYPQLAQNPIHRSAPAITELTQEVWDQANEYYLPTSFQISNIQAGTGASNVIPGHLNIDFNFRFSTASTAQSLQERVHAILDKHDLNYDLEWTIGGQPFLTPKGTLSDALSRAILSETGIHTELSTTGGTSDGRFIAQICPQVIEFGPINASIHKIDEHIAVSEIEPLKNIYRKTLENILLQ